MRTSILLLAIISVLYEDGNAQKLFRSECCQDYCYSTDAGKPQTKHFNSKSAYQIIKETENNKLPAIQNCTPVKLWMLTRHGTRLPEIEIIEEMPNLNTIRDEIIKNYEVAKSIPAKGRLCEQDLRLLKSWVLNKNITTNHAEYLTDQGWNDLKQLAQDYRTLYPNLLAREYNETEFLFRHTKNQRTKASFEAFIEGLFGADANQKVKLREIVGNDTLLRPFTYCPRWSQQIDKDTSPGMEISKFQHSTLMNQTISDISTRLGFESPLQYQQIQLIWDLCRLETAWFLDKPSAWCAALTLDEVEVLEYMDDLTSEYITGYANDLNHRVACEVVQDMLNRLNSNDEPRVSAYFSHSTLIQLFAVALGIFKDNALLDSTNYDSMRDRKWRTSILDPFTANFAAVKYDCSSNAEDPSLKVQFLLNQSPMQLSWCKNGLCKLSDVLSHYENYRKANCSKFFCSRNSGEFLRGSIAFILISIVYNWFVYNRF